MSHVWYLSIIPFITVYKHSWFFVFIQNVYLNLNHRSNNKVTNDTRCIDFLYNHSTIHTCHWRCRVTRDIYIIPPVPWPPYISWDESMYTLYMNGWNGYKCSLMSTSWLPCEWCVCHHRITCYSHLKSSGRSTVHSAYIAVSAHYKHWLIFP